MRSYPSLLGCHSIFTIYNLLINYVYTSTKCSLILWYPSFTELRKSRKAGASGVSPGVYGTTQDYWLFNWLFHTVSSFSKWGIWPHEQFLHLQPLWEYYIIQGRTCSVAYKLLYHFVQSGRGVTCDQSADLEISAGLGSSLWQKGNFGNLSRGLEKFIKQ